MNADEARVRVLLNELGRRIADTSEPSWALMVSAYDVIEELAVRAGVIAPAVGVPRAHPAGAKRAPTDGRLSGRNPNRVIADGAGTPDAYVATTLAIIASMPDAPSAPAAAPDPAPSAPDSGGGDFSGGGGDSGGGGASGGFDS